jgi:hypothetical protein
MKTITQTAVPAISADIAALMDDLTGFHPALDRLVAAFGDVLTADLDADQSQSTVAVLGGLADGSVSTLLGLALRRIADPDVNPALADLPADRKRTLRHLGAEYAAEISNRYLEQTASEACAAIEGV